MKNVDRNPPTLYFRHSMLSNDNKPLESESVLVEVREHFFNLNAQYIIRQLILKFKFIKKKSIFERIFDQVGPQKLIQGCCIIGVRVGFVL